MSSDTEILKILKTAYEREQDTNDFRDRITAYVYGSDLFYMFIEEAYDAIENDSEPIEQLISRWALTLCLHAESLDKDSIYTMQIVLWRELFYNVLAEIETEDEEEEFEDEDE